MELALHPIVAAAVSAGDVARDWTHVKLPCIEPLTKSEVRVKLVPTSTTNTCSRMTSNSSSTATATSKSSFDDSIDALSVGGSLKAPAAPVALQALDPSSALDEAAQTERAASHE